MPPTLPIPRLSRVRDRDRDIAVAVVTGAASGIGRATARHLARHGAKVHLADVDRTGLEETARLIAADGAGESRTHVVDVADSDAVSELADTVFAEDESVDLLHNNAGIGVGGKFIDLTLDDIDRTVRINLLGTLYGLHFFLPRMQEQPRPGHIVNTASGAGLVPIPLLGAYSATKHGVVAITETLHAEHAEGNVTFSVICPGVIDTPILRNSPQRSGMPDQSRMDEFIKRFAASPERVAEAVWDTYVRHKVVVVVAPIFVTPQWMLRRLSPTAAQAMSRLTTAQAGRMLRPGNGS